jgi:hypothetical protein
MLKPVFAALSFCAATAAGAESARLSGQQIMDLIAGATIEVDTPLGGRLPIRYAADGHLSGQARDLASYLGAPSDTGRWWVASDRLCHQWNRWFDAAPQCLRLRKEGWTIHWLNQDGNSGTAVIKIPAPVVTAAVRPPEEVATEVLVSAPEPTPLAHSIQLAAVPIVSREPSKPAQEEPMELPLSGEAPVAPSASAVPRSFPPERHEQRGAVAPFYIVANVERDDVLNVRSGPSTDFEVVGELQPGSRGVSITGRCRWDWCPVQHQSTRGWVNRIYLANDALVPPPVFGDSTIGDRAAGEGAPGDSAPGDNAPGDNAPGDRAPGDRAPAGRAAARDPPDAPRACLTPAARALLERIESRFGPVALISTCRPGATIAGTARPSRHASGNAVDFAAGSRKERIVEWLIANHRDGGTMTYPDMEHIHVDIGPHFVAIAGGQHWVSWRDDAADFPRWRSEGD